MITESDNEIRIKEENEDSIVSFFLTDDFKRVRVMELCDYHYREYLNKSQVDELIKKLTEMRERME